MGNTDELLQSTDHLVTAAVGLVTLAGTLLLWHRSRIRAQMTQASIERHLSDRMTQLSESQQDLRQSLSTTEASLRSAININQTAIDSYRTQVGRLELEFSRIDKFVEETREIMKSLAKVVDIDRIEKSVQSLTERMDRFLESRTR